jgi:hypothetical protein
VEVTTWSKNLTVEMAGHEAVSYVGSGHGADDR